MKLVPLDATDYEAIIPLAEVKRQLRVTSSSSDTEIEDLRDETIDWLESYAKRPMESRDFQLILDRFCPAILFPIAPVTAVTAVSYYSPSDTDTALTEEEWLFGSERLVASNIWPSTNGDPGNVRITFTAGEPSKILVWAAKVAMTAKYDNRSSPDLRVAQQIAARVRIPTL